MAFTFFALLISVDGANSLASSKSFGDYGDRLKIKTLNISINKHEQNVFYIPKQIKKGNHGCSLRYILQSYRNGNQDYKNRERMNSMAVEVCIKRPWFLAEEITNTNKLSETNSMMCRCGISTKKHFVVLHMFLSNQHRLN